MQDENNNQPVILNLSPVNDTFSQFVQLQSGILSEQEMFVPSDSILPVGTRVKVEYRLKSFGHRENVKIIDAIAEVIGPEVDSEKGRRGVRVKFIKLSPNSQTLISKLLEKMVVARPTSPEKRTDIAETQKSDQPKVTTEEPKVEISEPKASKQKLAESEPKVQINEPTSVSGQPIPSIEDVMARLEVNQKKEEKTTQEEQRPSTLAEIMSKEIEKPKSGELKAVDDKPAQYIFEYLPPGQPIEENTGLIKIREIVRSTDISSVKRTPKMVFFLIAILLLIVGTIGFFFAFPQYAPKIFVKSSEVTNAISKRDLSISVPPQQAPQPVQTPVSEPIAQKEEQVKPEIKKEEKVEEKKQEEKKAERDEEKAMEPAIAPLEVKKEKSERKEERVKIITGSKIKKEREKDKREAEEREKSAREIKTEKVATISKGEEDKAKTKKETQPAEPGKLIIQVTPTDADLTIFIDGTQVGTMPTISKQLPAGLHTIKVVAEGYNEEVRKVELGEGETKTIKINLKEK